MNIVKSFMSVNPKMYVAPEGTVRREQCPKQGAISRYFNIVWARFSVGALTALFFPLAAAECPTLLEVVDKSDRTILQLDRCSVKVSLYYDGPRLIPALKLSAEAAARWRNALKQDTAAWSELIQAKLNVRAQQTSVGNGVLVDANSARGQPIAIWRWDAALGEIRLEIPFKRQKQTAAPAEPACTSLAATPLILWLDELEVASGDLIAARPMLIKGPHQFEPLPEQCIDSWRLSPGAPAMIEPVSGVGVVQVNAVDGTKFSLTAQVGAKSVSGVIRVVDPKKHPLAGTWTQSQEVLCSSNEQRKPANPIRELRFTGAGKFSVTRTPFESYVDYQGFYRFSSQASELSLTVDSGNRKPKESKYSGKAVLSPSGDLIISPLPNETGGANDIKVCNMVFVRK